MKIPVGKNTFTNFISMFVRLVQGILIARWLIADLGEAQYGLWSMLWIFFSFALLLDLGFGVTAQKATATELWRKDIRKYNITISSIFCAHLMMSALIIPVTVLATIYVRELFHLPPELTDLSYYRTCIVLSGFGAAAVFPLGVFQEILVGLHKLYLRNYIQIISKLLEFCGVMVIFFCHGGLIALIIYMIIIIGSCTQLAMMICVYRSIPGLHIRPWFNKKALAGMFEFSSSAYLISMGRLIWERSSALLLSIFCGLASVGLFQLGSRIPMLVQQLTMPYIENISPIAARLHDRDRQEALSRIQNHLIRWVNFFAAGVTAAVLLAAPKMLYLLFHVDSPRIVLICRLMMLLIYAILVLRIIPEKSLTMVGQHRFLAFSLLAEDIFFLFLALVMLQFYPNELTLIAAMIISKGLTTVFLIAPRFFHLNRIPLRKFVLRTLSKPLAAALVTAAACHGIYSCLVLYLNEWVCFFLIGAAGVLLYLCILYTFIFDRIEKLQIQSAIHQLTSKIPKVAFYGTHLHRH